MHHLNLPECPQCSSILHRYPNPHPHLVKWVAAFRGANNDAHISACGRGKEDQERDFAKGVSRAHWGQSPHNYNAAVDWFRITQAGGAAFDRPWFQAKFATLNDPQLLWGGSFTSFPDFPHVEIQGWRIAAQDGSLSLVEPT